MDRIGCPICGEVHDLSEIQIGFVRPDAYYAVPAEEREQRCTLHSDLADIDRQTYFVRGVLQIPVRGEVAPFAWGIWVIVAEEAFHCYLERWDDPCQADEPPFPGWIATQLPGYSQTLGLPVQVQLSSVETRPYFFVADRIHPLGREQDHGIHLERVLELLSPFLHTDLPDPMGKPHLPVIDQQGWTVEDAAARFWARDQVFWIPSMESRTSVRVGEYAKLIFRIEASDARGRPEQHVERMWVLVDHSGDGPFRYSGILQNTPHVPGIVRKGMRVWFTPDHVVDIGYEDESLASGGEDVVHCYRHGNSHATYVCQHLLRGDSLGFNQAEDPETPRPDAWCDTCESILAKEGEWNERSEAVAGITLLCGACYDLAEQRNRKV